MSPEGGPRTLEVTLPDVVSWARPRRWGGRARYPASYTARRDGWAAVVAHAVAAQGWDPPARARYQVAVAVFGGGKRDLDRVCTAVLDALQGGGAVRDDCLVDALTAGRSPVRAGDAPATVVRLVALPDPPGPAPRRRAARRVVAGDGRAPERRSGDDPHERTSGGCT